MAGETQGLHNTSQPQASNAFLKCWECLHEDAIMFTQTSIEKETNTLMENYGILHLENAVFANKSAFFLISTAISIDHNNGVLIMARLGASLFVFSIRSKIKTNL